ncbi:MAG: mercuric reductase [Gemmatimonadales bacterium]
MTHDPADAELLANVHPPDWINPVAQPMYDLVVLGAGTGGLVAAAGAAGLGARVALVERHLMGGDCLNVGCVPSKAIVAAARAWHGARHAIAFGGPTAIGPGDFGGAMRRMRALRAGLSPIDSAVRFRALGVDVFLGNGTFTGDRTLMVEGARLRFKRAVIATGARATVPPIPGLKGSGYLTNASIFSLESLPPRLLVLGGGPIGSELAQAFARFGSAVTIIDRGDRLLPHDDADAAEIVRHALRSEGVSLEFTTTVERIERQGSEITLACVRGGERFRVTGDALLVAIGRTANVEGCGLDLAGVVCDQTGVVVNKRLQTSNRRVFAVGDVCSRLQFTHSADFQSRLVLANALFFGRGNHKHLVTPWCTYTDPEVAHVGVTPATAAKEGIAIDTITVPFDEVDRAVLEGDAVGFLRVHLKSGSDKILGVTIVDAHAGELIGEAAVAITNGLGLGALGKTMHPYPTKVEAYRKAADQWRRGKLTPMVKRLMAFWFRWFR